MQIIRLLLRVFILGSISIACLAEPPFQILRTCIEHEPYEKSTITELDGQGYSKDSLEGCEDQFGRTMNGHVYGTVRCNDKFYLIIKDKKMDPELAVNKSVNLEINPGVEFTIRSSWYKIHFEQKEYLCISAPLAEQGVGAAHNQYYIIEDAFDAKVDPKIYYYFLDKNIAPITSNTL